MYTVHGILRNFVKTVELLYGRKGTAYHKGPISQTILLEIHIRWNIRIVVILISCRQITATFPKSHDRIAAVSCVDFVTITIIEIWLGVNDNPPHIWIATFYRQEGELHVSTKYDNAYRSTMSK